MIRELIPIALGGALGASLRHLSAVAMTLRFGAVAWPWWLLAVNVLGSFLIGIFWALLQESRISVQWAPFLMTGVLGGYTTFSAFSLDTLRLVEDGRIGVAGLYVVATVVMSFAAAWVGLSLTRAVL